MKKSFWIVAVATMFFASCAKDNAELRPAISATEDFTATFELDTRTSLDGTAVVWCEDDLLTIFTKTSHNRKYQVKELSEDGRTATFGYVSFTGSNDAKITSNYALYPYDADATLTGGVVTTTLQPTQIYNGANGNLGYALMAAQSATNNFSFRNAGSLLRFKVSKLVPDAFTLKTIKVASANNNIAGEVTINLNSAEAKAIVTSNGVKEITLADINYDVTTEVEEFYVAMPSMSFADKDLTVTFVFAEGEKVFELPAFDLEQGKIKSITYAINDAEDFTGGTPDSGEIVPIAKPAANEIWYTTTDGEMASVYSNEQIVKAYVGSYYTHYYDETNGVWVLRFDDLEKLWKFPNVDEEWFFSDNVSSVIMPDCIEEITGLRGLPNLTTITLSTNLKTIDRRAFYGCSSLAEIAIPNSVTTIGDSAFDGCSSLASITIPHSVTSIGNYAFRGCNNIKNLIIPDGVSTIYTSSLPSLNSLTIGSNVTSIQRDDDRYYGYYTIYCKPTTPPSGLMGYNGLIYEDVAGLTTIYVPRGCADSYTQKIDNIFGSHKPTVIEIDF